MPSSLSAVYQHPCFTNNHGVKKNKTTMVLYSDLFLQVLKHKLSGMGFWKDLLLAERLPS